MGLSEEPKDKYTHLVVPAKELKFDDAHEQLVAAFDGVDLTQFDALTLSGNSYGTEACRWIAGKL